MEGPVHIFAGERSIALSHRHAADRILGHLQLHRPTEIGRMRPARSTGMTGAMIVTAVALITMTAAAAAVFEDEIKYNAYCQKP